MTEQAMLIRYRQWANPTITPTPLQGASVESVEQDSLGAVVTLRYEPWWPEGYVERVCATGDRSGR